MTDDNATKIAELEATLRMPGLPAAAREAVEQQLGALRGQRSLQQSGGVNFGVGTTVGQTGDIVAGDQTRARSITRGASTPRQCGSIWPRSTAPRSRAGATMRYFRLR